MALSMDEQRMLDEMERKLADDDPLLASRLGSFGHPGLAALLRSRRIRLVLAFTAMAVIAVASVLVYAIGPFRAHPARSAPGRSAASPGVSQPVTPTGASSASSGSGSRAP